MADTDPGPLVGHVSPSELAANYAAMLSAIGYEPVRVSIAGHPGIRETHRTLEDRDGLIRRIFAAGFRLAPERATSTAAPFPDGERLVATR